MSYYIINNNSFRNTAFVTHSFLCTEVQLLIWATVQWCKQGTTCHVNSRPPERKCISFLKWPCLLRFPLNSITALFLSFTINAIDAYIDVVKMIYAFGSSVVSKFENCCFKKVFFSFFPHLFAYEKTSHHQKIPFPETSF